MFLDQFYSMSRANYLFLFAAFGCIGITTEIFFTAIVDAITAVQLNEPINWRLLGMSYIWMFPIYGLAGIALPLLYGKIEQWPTLLRWAFYGVAILCVEFVAGWILDMATGRCPWEYTTGWHIMGYIRLDYYPLWVGFGIMIERIYLLLRQKLHLNK
jgi:uncharacterized membrane protein